MPLQLKTTKALQDMFSALTVGGGITSLIHLQPGDSEPAWIMHAMHALTLAGPAFHFLKPLFSAVAEDIETLAPAIKEIEPMLPKGLAAKLSEVDALRARLEAIEARAVSAQAMAGISTVAAAAPVITTTTTTTTPATPATP